MNKWSREGYSEAEEKDEKVKHVRKKLAYVRNTESKELSAISVTEENGTSRFEYFSQLIYRER